MSKNLPKVLDVSNNPEDEGGLSEIEMQEAKQKIGETPHKVDTDTLNVGPAGNRNPDRPTSAHRGEVNEGVNLHDAIKKKVSEYNPDEKVDSKSEYTTTEKMSLFAMIKLYADGTDKCFISIGLFASLLFSCALPGFSFIFGTMIDEVGSKADNNQMKNNTYMMLIIGVFVGTMAML